MSFRLTLVADERRILLTPTALCVQHCYHPGQTRPTDAMDRWAEIDEWTERQTNRWIDRQTQAFWAVPWEDKYMHHIHLMLLSLYYLWLCITPRHLLLWFTWARQTRSASCARMSTSFPFPSSPHCPPSTTVTAIASRSQVRQFGHG